jgi:hypothetical protein
MHCIVLNKEQVPATPTTGKEYSYRNARGDWRIVDKGTERWRFLDGQLVGYIEYTTPISDGPWRAVWFQDRGY